MDTSELRYTRRALCDPDDEIVISGISGRFPNSANIAEFANNLYNKVDMVDDAETRWKHIDSEIPRRLGKTVNLDKFDASFFSVHHRQAAAIDPQCRMLLEHSYEAVLDAGISPKDLRGSRTGVFIGCCFVESEQFLFYEKTIKDGLGLTGSARAMLANRISFGMDLQGPSFLIDTACSSACYALDAAFDSIRNGQCESAIVGGANLLLHPHLTLQFARLGVLSKDGFCRPLDKDAAGYTRSEAITVLFLQKKKDAKRVYANLVYCKTNNDGFKKEGITYPSGFTQIKLLDEFYKDLRMDPRKVDYVEGHSTGTRVGDPEECHTLDTIFCQDRKSPLLIGAVKSNMGHSEASSSICSVIKSLIAFENKKLPPTIHYREPRSDCKSLIEGRLKVIDNVTDFNGKLIGINSFGFGGGNGHALLRAISKEKVNYGIPNDHLPRLVTWSGRTEEAIDTILNAISERPLDGEFVALLQNTQINTVMANTYRGYGIFSQNGEGGNATCINKSVKNFSDSKRPMVWVYSGMGSQFISMGKDLMKIPIFESAINKCHDVLAAKGMDLKEILTSSDPKTFDNILNAFVGISAVQVGLTDILKTIGLEPDYLIGHSFGELGCAYADGCCDAEEMILSAYSRGMASLETKVIFGSMAAVGLGYAQLKDMLPEGVVIACHNSSDSSTISGPAECISEFVKKLKSENIFAKEVACSNIPYHSEYISQMGPKLLNRLTEVIKNPKKRSSKWISSSVPEAKWDDVESQFSSAQYHANNLLNPVLFEEACKHLPKDALTIEVAPYGLLQAILKRSFPEGSHFSLAQRNNQENCLYFINSLGRLFENGVDFDASKLYPPIEWPVSRGTPMVAPLIRWDHKESYFVLKFDEMISSEKKFAISLLDNEFEYVSGHEIDSRCLFPATGYLFLVWQAFAYQYRIIIEDFDVEFEDVKFMRATTLSKNHDVELWVVIQKGTGNFEVLEGNTTVVSGVVRRPQQNSKMITFNVEDDESVPTLFTKDFYKELRLRGYNYKALFRSVVEARADGQKGQVKWQDNWVPFLDCLLQLQIIANDTRSLVLPTGLRKLTIKPRELLQAVEEHKDVNVICSQKLNALRCSGIEMRGLVANSVGRRAPPGVPVLESYQFIPHLLTQSMTIDNMARFCVQLALENFPVPKVVSVEVDTYDDREILSEYIGTAIGDLPLVTSDLSYVTQRDRELPSSITIIDTDVTSCGGSNTFIIKSGCLGDSHFLEASSNLFTDIGFIISRESNSNNFIKPISLPNNFQVIAAVPTESEIFVLIKYQKVAPQIPNKVVKISSNDEEMLWLNELQNILKEGHEVIAYAEKEELSGIIGLINCIRKEPNGSNVKCVFVDDPRAPTFDVNNPFYRNILNQGLAMNVYRNGKWGSYKHLVLNKEFPPIRTSAHCSANSLQRSDLSSIKWLQGNMAYSKPKGRIVKIQYTSLNFRDVMLATGKLAVETCGKTRLDQQCVLGFEFSGVSDDGKRVMGMVVGGALSTHVEMDETLLWNVPDNWTLEQAASVPVVYGTVYAAFFLTIQIQSGKSILIHAGSGGVGLAGIRVAFAYGLEVFTTVSTEEKKNHLLKEFPQLKAENIGNSRDTTFEDLVMSQTNGKGVDYVLNSLSEEKLRSSIKCLAQGGKFLEIGKFDMASDNKIGLGDFLRELSFHAVLVDNLIKSTFEEKMTLKRLLERDLHKGIIQPLKTTSYEASDIEQAFRFLASGKHIGKVVLRLRENENDDVTIPISILPRVYCHPEYSYIIPGGLGGFGLELADWLVMRGCRKIVLSSSRGITKQYQAYRIKIWESYGVKIAVDTSDITTKSGCEKLLRTAMMMGPVGGIFNLAVLLRDSIFENQDTTKFKESMAPKAYATKYLDELSRVLCPHLEYFVIFSSVSCGRGNAGQSNYGMANSVMERIMEQRKKVGLPAKAIQWGAVGEVGLVADMQEDKIDMEIGGTLQQRISSCLEELDYLISSEYPIVSSMVVAEKRYTSSSSGNIIETLMNVMSIKDIKSVSMETTLSEMGMDSLMTVEILQILEREYDIVIPAQELRSMSLSQLKKLVDSKNSGDDNTRGKVTSNVPKGVALLMRNLGDEANSNQTILKLESKTDEGVKVLIIPGLEGMAGKAWYAVAKELNHPTFILQTGSTWMARSLDEIFEGVIEDVIKLFKHDRNFLIVGYSFGAMLTLKIASSLEKIGKSGKVVFIDGAPKFLKKLAVEHLPQNFTENDIHNIILINTILTCFPSDDGKIVKKILSENSWETRVKKLTEMYQEEKIYSIDYGVKMLNSLVNRLILTTNVDLKAFRVLEKTPLTLIRTTEYSLQNIENDYGLDIYSKNPIDIKILEGNHATVLDNPKLYQTLNDM